MIASVGVADPPARHPSGRLSPTARERGGGGNDVGRHLGSLLRDSTGALHGVVVADTVRTADSEVSRRAGKIADVTQIILRNTSPPVFRAVRPG